MEFSILCLINMNSSARQKLAQLFVLPIGKTFIGKSSTICQENKGNYLCVKTNIRNSGIEDTFI